MHLQKSFLPRQLVFLTAALQESSKRIALAAHACALALWLDSEYAHPKYRCVKMHSFTVDMQP